MKKIIALALVVVMALAVVASAETLKMGTNAFFPPYEYYGDEDETVIIGIDAEIAAAICEYLGYELEIVNMEFASIIPAIKSGKVDFGMAGMTITEDRLENVDFSDSYTTAVQVVIVPEGSPITCVDDLTAEGANYKIAVQEGTTGDLYTTWDIEDEGLGEVLRFKTGNDATLALTSGKADCVVIDLEPAKNYVAANEGLKILDTEYALEYYAIALDKGSELVAKFNEALAALTESGKVQEIIDKYIPTETAAE